MADLRLSGSRAETQHIEHAYLSDPGEQWAQMERGPSPDRWTRGEPDGSFAGGRHTRTYRPFDVADHGSEHRVVEGERVLIWMRMDCIDAYQDPDGPIELSPYLDISSLDSAGKGESGGLVD